MELNRKISYLLALKDAIDVARRAPVLVAVINPIGRPPPATKKRSG